MLVPVPGAAGAEQRARSSGFAAAAGPADAATGKSPAAAGRIHAAAGVTRSSSCRPSDPQGRERRPDHAGATPCGRFREANARGCPFRALAHGYTEQRAAADPSGSQPWARGESDVIRCGRPKPPDSRPGTEVDGDRSTVAGIGRRDLLPRPRPECPVGVGRSLQRRELRGVGPNGLRPGQRRLQDRGPRAAVTGHGRRRVARLPPAPAGRPDLTAVPQTDGLGQGYGRSGRELGQRRIPISTPRSARDLASNRSHTGGRGRGHGRAGLPGPPDARDTSRPGQDRGGGAKRVTASARLATVERCTANSTFCGPPTIHTGPSAMWSRPSAATSCGACAASRL